MTIKKRLVYSNILMILVPVISTTLVGIFCIGFIWLCLVNGVGLGITDQEDFDRACMAITETIELSLERNAQIPSMEPLLRGNGLTLSVVSDGTVLYEYGEREEGDIALVQAAGLLGGETSITHNGRRLYTKQEFINGTEYTVYLFGGNYVGSYNSLKIAIVIAALVILFTVFLSILLTNWFLTSFVFKKIEEPLDILTRGVHEIRDGNLEYQIQYDRKDEFWPICQDFNEMALRLKQSVELTQKQEVSRKELIAGISHDIRSPLTSIQAYVEGLLDGVAKTPQAQQKYLKTIKEKAEDLAHIVSQLFLFSKMELGEYPENPCLLSLDEVIGSTVSALQEEYEKQGMTIHTKLSAAKVYGDPIQMRRIITNILENSLKYKQKEQGTIWIYLEKTENGCQLTFLDDGPGVSAEALPHLFEVFYRSDPSRKNPHQGSGLGLAIVSNAVQRMGGSIQAFSNQPTGLGIRITFPHEVRKNGENIDH